MGDLLIIALFLASVLTTLSSLDDAFIDLLAIGITRYRLPPGCPACLLNIAKRSLPN